MVFGYATPPPATGRPTILYGVYGGAGTSHVPVSGWERTQNTTTVDAQKPRIFMQAAGTITAFSARIAEAAGGLGDTVTLEKNGVVVATLTFAAAAPAGTVESTTLAVAVAVGDTLMAETSGPRCAIATTIGD